MTYFFVNTYQTLFQCIAFHSFERESVFYISDQCKNYALIKKILNKNGITCYVDEQYNFENFVNKVSTLVKRLLIYNFFNIKKPNELVEVYINGSISSFERLKYLALSSQVHYLDGGYQHYYHYFSGCKNFFYCRDGDKGVSLLKDILFGFRVRYGHKKIKNVIFVNEYLADSSACVLLVKNAGKYREEFHYLSAIENNDYKYRIVNELFPGFNAHQPIFNGSEKTICILTQPFFEDGYMSKERNLEIYKKYLNSTNTEDTQVFLKIHPRESNTKYAELFSQFDITELDGSFPFELLELYRIKFDIGVSYNSTAVFSNSFSRRVILN